MTDMVRTEFVDMSFWQGVVDFSKVDPAIHAFWLKTSEGNFTDKMFKIYKADCIQDNKDYGTYHFFRAMYTGEAQAQLALTMMNHEMSNMPMMFDYEADNGMNLDTVNERARAYCEYVRKYTDTIPLIYTAKWFLNRFWYQKLRGRLDWMKEYPLWLAEYPWDKKPNFIQNFSIYRQMAISGTYFPTAPAPWTQVEMWQWTGHGRVVGMSGDVDMNVSAAEIVPPTAPAVHYYQVNALLGLRVREQPNTQAKIITTLSYKAVVEIDTVSNGWGYSKGLGGWMYMAYLTQLS